MSLFIKNGRAGYSRLIFLLLFVCPVYAFAQNTKKVTVIYLKKDTGLIEIHGQLIPAKDSGMISIRTAEGNVWVFPRSEIGEVRQEKTIFPLTAQGWYNTTTFGGYFGDENGYQIQSIAGYRFHYLFYTGIGVALDHYSIRSLPVFIDLRADLLKNKSTPFAYADIGITNPWPKRSQYEYAKEPDKKIPGWYLNVGIGQRIRSRKSNHSWQLSIGYSLETMKLRYLRPVAGTGFPQPGEEQPGYLTEDFKYNFNRFVIKAGFTL